MARLPFSRTLRGPTGDTARAIRLSAGGAFMARHITLGLAMPHHADGRFAALAKVLLHPNLGFDGTPGTIINTRSPRGFALWTGHGRRRNRSGCNRGPWLVLADKLRCSRASGRRGFLGLSQAAHQHYKRNSQRRARTAVGHMDSFKVLHRMAFSRGCDRVNPLEADPATPHFLEPRLRRLLRPQFPTVFNEAPGS